MKGAMIFVLLAVVHSIDDGDFYEEFRKHYGLSFNNNCKSYVKVFKCMTACKSVGFQVFRVDFKCKCRCHEMKTSTFLPFFKWRTNGTTRKVPTTNSPRLYSIVGTASPQEHTTVEETETEVSNTTLPICVTVTSTVDGNDTVDANSTTTVDSDSTSNSTDEVTTPSDKEGETTAADGTAVTTAGGTDGGDGADDAPTTVAPPDDAEPDAPTDAPPAE